ncbi:unnamed protein product [Echinostoma caproni]|uniref:WD_REPEATS_REGION domain-containing protein n=1 Tax=Echinostoma caproni TaxID=27848 RepID=A0A183AE60_9TREM|nr:unnamed protein product [Echinostoma caproni]
MRIWKMTSVANANIVPDGTQHEEESPCLPTVDSPLFDLASPGEKLTSVVLKSVPGQLDPDIELACGYRDSGIIRLFHPSQNRLIQEITHHQGCIISALQYSHCGKFLYSADSSGTLAVWRLQSNKEPPTVAKLLRTRPKQIAVFSSPSHSKTNTASQIRSILSCCPDEDRMAYIGPSPNVLTIACGPSLQTTVRINLDQLSRRCFPHQPDPLFGTLGVSPITQPILLNFSARCPYSGISNVILATPTGHIFRFHGRDGRLLAYATFGAACLLLRSNRLDSTGDSRDTPVGQTQWSTMAISPDGRFMVLADAARPLLYTTSVRLHLVQPNKQYATTTTPDIRWRLQYKTFSGHLYPVTSVLFTRDQKCCVTIDQGFGLVGGSAIFVWKFSHPYRKVRIGLNRSIDEYASADPRQDYTNKTTTTSYLESPMNKTDCGTNDLSFPKTPPPSVVKGGRASTLNGVISEGELSSVPSEFTSNKQIKPSNPPQSYCHPKWPIAEVENLTSSLTKALDREEALLTFSKYDGCHNAIVRGVIGYAPGGLTVDSLVWDTESGLFVFIAGMFLICEHLETGRQQVYASKYATQSESSDSPNVPRLCSEMLTTMALSCSRRQLAVGSMTKWEVITVGDTTNRTITESTRYQESRSDIILIPLKSCQSKFQFHPNREGADEQETIELGGIKRLPYSKVLREQTSAFGQFRRNPLLLRLTFTQNSRHLITIGEFHASVVGLWCTRTGSLLQCCIIEGALNQVACSSISPEWFVTVGVGNTAVSRSVTGPLVFWKITEFGRFRGDTLVPEGADCGTLAGREFSSAVYITVGDRIHEHSAITCSTASGLRELLVVSDVVGLIYIWNPERRRCLFTWRPGCFEHGLLTTCGPTTLLTGDASGRLCTWHLSVGFSLSANESAQSSRPRHYSDSSEFTDLASTVTVKQIREIRTIQHHSPSAIIVGHFDADGQLGVVGTNDSNLWYIDWSNVNESETTSHTDLADDIAAGVVRLFAGHEDEICALAWWNPQSSISVENPSNTGEFTPLLLTVSAVGTIRAWDVNSRELLCQIRVKNRRTGVEDNRKMAASMTTLEQFQFHCCGLETGGISDGEDVRSGQFIAVGCVAVACADTSLQLFCLHKLRLVSQIPPVSPSENDCTTALHFIGPDHLALGTRNGLIILLTIQQNGRIAVTRVLRDHVNESNDPAQIVELKCYPWSVSRLTTDEIFNGSCSVRSRSKHGGARSDRSTDTTFDLLRSQSNRSTLSESMREEMRFK